LFLAPFGKGNPPPKLGSPDTILYRESEGLRTPDNPELHFTPNPITDQIQDGVYDLVYTVDEDLRIHILTAHRKDSKLAD
jgi:hypothetical protein